MVCGLHKSFQFWGLVMVIQTFHSWFNAVNEIAFTRCYIMYIHIYIIHHTCLHSFVSIFYQIIIKLGEGIMATNDASRSVQSTFDLHRPIWIKKSCQLFADLHHPIWIKKTRDKETIRGRSTLSPRSPNSESSVAQPCQQSPNSKPLVA